MMVFKYDDNGNVARRRSLKAASATTWGVSLDLVHDEVAVTIEQYNKVAVFRREAEGDEKPLRIILDRIPDFPILTGYSSILRTTKSSSPTMTHTMSLPPMTIPRRRQPRNSLAASRLQPYGNVAPKAMLKGSTTMLIAPRGAALDFEHQEMFVIDKVQNAFFAYSWQKNPRGFEALNC